MTSRSRYRLKLAGAALLAASGVVCAVVAAAAVTVPSLDIPLASRLAIAGEARAYAAAQRPDGAAVALAETEAVLSVAPMTSDAWLRKAYVQTRDGARLDAESLAAIERSYTISPMTVESPSWRVWFLYQHWPELTPSLRRQAEGEYEHIVLNRRTFDQDGITNPAGRMAAAMTRTRALQQRAVSDSR